MKICRANNTRTGADAANDSAGPTSNAGIAGAKSLAGNPLVAALREVAFALRHARCLVIGCVAVAISGSWSLPAATQPSFKGQTVTAYVSGGVGGGVDVYARTFIAHFARHLPGNPTVVASNLPGAGGLQAVLQLYNTARRDGTAFGVFNPGPISEAFTGKGKGLYDINKFEWVGSLAKSGSNCFVWHASPIKSLQDAYSREVALSVTGADSGAARLARVYNAVLGTKFKLIAGYAGAGSSLLALERGEVDGTCISSSALRSSHPHWLQEKKVRMLVQTAFVRDPSFPDVPLVFDLIKNDIDRQSFEFMIIPYEILNTIALPPGVSPEIRAAYRKAFDATVADEHFLADAKKRQQDVDASSGEEVDAMIAKLSKVPKAVLERVTKATEAR
jgi:tripartite-type tricarboxylate transporter receptor subunit TctC